jgi:hypothetical protein
MTPDDDLTDEQVQSLVAACPQASLFGDDWQHLDGYHQLRITTFYEQALEALKLLCKGGVG